MEIEKLRDDLKSLAKRVNDLEANIQNEEQTKNAFIMPFFQALGYDVFNPIEFIPEYTADVGIKKGEKVDYAVAFEGKPAILIECKSITENLDNHDSQLFRYFSTTDAKFGILTNGKEYRFYTDLDAPNKMDSVPFLKVELGAIKDSQFAEIAKFHKDNFDVETITSSASELKYLNAFKDFLASNLATPSEQFVEFAAKQIYNGRITSTVKQSFIPIITKGFNQFVAERVNEKLNAALNTNSNVQAEESTVEAEEPNSKDDSKIITTPEELETYTVVKMLVKDNIEPERVFYRDNRSYFNVLLDDNNRKWILRFWESTNKSTIEIRDFGKFDIQTPLDITTYAEQLKETIEKYK
ncbi:type I restriction endonuclease [Lactococcus termiticola]|uniref:Prophage protein n=1 Tax=Lactococcus termiticola TaxID=2169526 RepID=A0A2R5HD81_9LACT|nr:type I restriction endonuclease [Lactococcus termiticola]GBG96033.1 prophage protein [Lactococcus termiticola]